MLKLNQNTSSALGKTPAFEIPISKIEPSFEPVNTNYSLKTNFFDPDKSSPPNDFMMKLNMRMSVYVAGNPGSPATPPVN